MQRVRAGDNAELIELGSVSAAELHAAAARVRAEPGVLACIPGHSSLYVIRGSRSSSVSFAREPRELRVPVVFDGEDLPELLERVSRDEFLARVATLRLTARYLGFRGGFAYLEGWPEEWAMPRRATSRPVKKGAFAIAGNVAGFYPIDTPGGWRVLGRTGLDLENGLVAGDVIVIEPVAVAAATALPSEHTKAAAAAAALQTVELIQSPLTTLVAAADWSRVERGLSPGGAFDDVAAARAMSAVDGEVALFESAMTGPRLRFHRDATVAWCTPDLSLRVERVRAGEERAFGRITGGLRGYLAIGENERSVEPAQRVRDNVIKVMRGPHDIGLSEIECEVTPQLNRVGIRLRPLSEIDVEIPADMRSIGMQCGTVQLHPDGSLVAMGPDHPVTGGYLQPMTVITSERWKLAQLVPGERVTLRAYEPN